MDRLPSEMLEEVLIFSIEPNRLRTIVPIARVCKRWNELIKTGKRIWRAILQEYMINTEKLFMLKLEPISDASFKDFKQLIADGRVRSKVLEYIVFKTEGTISNVLTMNQIMPILKITRKNNRPVSTSISMCYAFKFDYHDKAIFRLNFRVVKSTAFPSISIFKISNRSNCNMFSKELTTFYMRESKAQIYIMVREGDIYINTKDGITHHGGEYGDYIFYVGVIVSVGGSILSID